MELLKRKYGIRIIWFGDDCFNLNRRRNEQFLEELEQRNLNMQWYIETRVDTLLRDADLVPRMARLGLFHVLLGVESSSEYDLKYLKKDIRLGEIKKAVALLKQHDIIAHTNFIVGLPHDTRKSIRRTIAFAKWLDPDVAVFVPLTPFPGTELYDEIASAGLLTELDFANFDFITPVARTNSLSRRQLQKEIIKGYVQFYARPTKIIRSHFSRNTFVRKTFLHMFRFMSTYMIKRYFQSDVSTT